MRFTASRSALKVLALDRQSSMSNYLIGNSPSAWHTGIPNFARIAYPNLYPGIDLYFYGDHRSLEHDFVISPGADYRQIRIQLDGGQRLSLRDDGSLSLITADGNLVFKAPHIYQYQKHRKVEIAGRYSLASTREFGFDLGPYDRSLPLVIDPVLAYSTYLAGSNTDLGNAIAVDQLGSAYVTGYTFSADFPLQNPVQGTCANSCSSPDVFVTKFSTDGSALIYSTFVGGTNYDQGTSIAVDSQGNAIVVGTTSSFDFPQKNGLTAVLSTNTHGFAFSLNPTGSAFNFSTYLGGVGGDAATGVATDASGNVYVAGYTSSVNFPLTPGNQIGPPPTNYQNDIFLTKLGPSGALLSSTIVGGTSSNWQGTFGNENFPVSVAVDAQGDALLAGSAFDGFPTTFGAFQQNYIGTGNDTGFAALLNASGSAFLYATYLGGTGGDNTTHVALDAHGNVFLSGVTYSSDFPTTPGAFQTTKLGSGQVAFVTAMDPTLSSLVYSTYLGPTTNDYYEVTLSGIALDSQGNAYLAGYSRSSYFPLVSPLMTTLPQNPPYGNAYASFLSVLNPSGSALTFSTFLAGSVSAAATAVALDSSANPYITGYTFDPDFPTTPGSFQTTIPTPPYPMQHAFVTKFSLSAPNASACLSTNLLYFGDVIPGKSSPRYPVTATNCGTLPLKFSSITVTNPDFVITQNKCKTLAAGDSCTLNVHFAPPVADGQDVGNLVFKDNAPISPQTVSLQGYSGYPNLYYYATDLNFGDQPVGVKSAPYMFEVWNYGGLPVHIKSLTASGDFAPVKKCPAELYPGDYCSLGATFTPTTAGPRTGTLSIYDDAYGSPQTINLEGNGVTSYPTPTITNMFPSSAPAKSATVQVTIYGTNFFANSVVTLNGKTVPSKLWYSGALQFKIPSSLLKKIGSVSVQVVNPGPAGGSSPASFIIFGQASVGAADMIYEPFTQKIYASIPANSAANPNSLVTIDPATGTIGSPIAIGYNPGALGLSDDGTTLYVALADNSIVPFNVQTQAVGAEIPLGFDPQKGSFTATDIQVQPGHPTTVVAAVTVPYQQQDGIELIQNGAVVSGFYNEPPNNIAVGGTRFINATDFFGWNAIWGDWGLDHFVIIGNTLYETTGINGEYGMGAFDTDGTNLFDVDGQVFNAASGALVGTIAYINNYSPEKAVLTDISSGRTFFVDQSGTVLAVDSQTLQLVGTPVSISATTPLNRLMHWGQDGIAFPTDTYGTGSYDLITARTNLFLPSTDQNPTPTAASLSPSTVASKGSNFVLTVSGANFVRGAVVTWNGAGRTTTWFSDSKVLADIPASDIAKPGSAKITVVNPPPAGGSSATLTLTMQ